MDELVKELLNALYATNAAIHRVTDVPAFKDKDKAFYDLITVRNILWENITKYDPGRKD